MTFGKALDIVENGGLVAREGWNGEDMFIFSRPGNTLNADIFLGAKSIPEKVKDYFEQKHQPIVDADDLQVKFTPYLCMKAADDTIVNGWLASQTDLTAKDWYEVNL